MKTRIILPLVLTSILLAGCARTRSISNSGYNASERVSGVDRLWPVPITTPSAPRELSEFDVLGLDPDKNVTEEDIQQALTQSQPVKLSSGNTVLLVQSGTAYPDGPMVAELGKHFQVVPFTGLVENKKPGTPQEAAPEYSRTLRLAAARAGAKTVMCYWGILESGSEKFVTKTVSWLPLMNWVVPDESQHMRIRIKIALLDVASGSWSVYSSEPLESSKWSVRSRRDVADQKQVEAIKKKAYESAVQGLVQTYIAAL